MIDKRHGSSFRDPSGFVYFDGDTLLRQVNRSYAAHYDRLMQSGLYDALVQRGWLVPHVERPGQGEAYRVLEPRRVPYVSYPYEWCFTQLKDAALLTLDIQRLSLGFGMVLKDASAYNVQFVGARPVFIDTLSFETYEEGRPWIAYRQFCEHFLGPLAFMAHRDLRLRRLAGTFIDGVPLDLVASLLPRRTQLRYGLLAHVHLHARSQRRHQDAGRSGPRAPAVPSLSRQRLEALTSSLRATVEGCRLPELQTEWSGYYDDTNYTDEAMAAKERLVPGMLEAVAGDATIVHDLGANTGRFSRLAAQSGRYVVAHDVDELAVDRAYRAADGSEEVLPLVLDLTSPAPALGWALEERESALARMQGGAALALALVHHLAIGNNVPLARIAALFGAIVTGLVIEFVPKDDSQVQRMLATREDVFPDYTVEGFETAFAPLFETVRREALPGSSRVLYAMRRREHLGPQPSPVL